MWLFETLLKAELLLPWWLLIEVALPLARKRPMLPMSRWVLRKTLGLVLNRTPTETMVMAATRREREAQVRLVAAERDLKAAETEKKAAELESTTNDIRGEIQ